jgi:hypothetical protein
MMALRCLFRVITMSLLCLTVLATWGQSQEAVTLTPEERRAALGAIAAAFETHYVFPELRAQIVAKLRDSERSGRYATEDPRVLAERVTEDLIEVSGDKHLFLAVDPGGYEIASRAGDERAAEEAVWQRHAVRNHHGLTEMRVLGGNVRYLRVSAFEWINDASGLAYDGAMRFLSEGDAAIIDLRGNGGGAHAAVRYLISHFMPSDELEMTFLEGAKDPVQSRTLEHLPAGRLLGVPLYVLIDLSSASAAEAFAYDVRHFKLGELVGTRTVGAANNNKLLPIAPYFLLSVSYGRPVHPVSGTNWEGVGVEPTIAAPASQALEVAHSVALQRLSEHEGASPEDRVEYAWAKTAADARLRPATVAAAQLRRLAGKYGQYEVEFHAGELWLRRPNRERARLSALDASGLFAVERLDSLRVRLTGRSMEVLRMGDPNSRVFARN